MAILNFFSDEMAPDSSGNPFRGRPTNDHGKLRIQFFTVSPIAAQADITSQIDLCTLPPGKVRVLEGLSRLTNSAFGAGATLSLGLRAYNSRDDQTGIVNTEDGVALANALPVAAANAGQAFNIAVEDHFYSKAGIGVFATIGGAAMPVAASISGYIVYVYD